MLYDVNLLWIKTRNCQNYAIQKSEKFKAVLPHEFTFDGFFNANHEITFRPDLAFKQFSATQKKKHFIMPDFDTTF